MKNEISLRWKRNINIIEPMRQHYIQIRSIAQQPRKVLISIRDQIKYLHKHWLFTNFKDNGIVINLSGDRYHQRFIKGFYWRIK